MILPGLKHHMIASGGVIREPEVGGRYDVQSAPYFYFVHGALVFATSTASAHWGTSNKNSPTATSTDPSVEFIQGPDGWIYYKGELVSTIFNVYFYRIYRERKA